MPARRPQTQSAELPGKKQAQLAMPSSQRWQDLLVVLHELGQLVWDGCVPHAVNFPELGLETRLLERLVAHLPKAVLHLQHMAASGEARTTTQAICWHSLLLKMQEGFRPSFLSAF